MDMRQQSLIRGREMYREEMDFRTDREELLNKVPEITFLFWVTKVLTTGMGEVFSDYLVKQMNPILAVLLCGMGLGIAFVLQFMLKRYSVPVYWWVVVMVSIFGTMVADIIHVVLGVPYLVSTMFFATVLAFVFYVWFRCEGTLSIHCINTRRREFFYWSTVLATFALGTASGDLVATTFQWGYLPAGLFFEMLLILPALVYMCFRKYAIATFWFAYIMTRPFGASFSDWLSKPHQVGGENFGEGSVSLVLTVAILSLVICLQIIQQKKIHQPGYIEK